MQCFHFTCIDCVAGGGYGEGEESGSPHSTPSNSQAEEPPFAADNLGDTVIRLDKACMYLHIYSVHVREMQKEGRKKQAR